MDLRLNNSTVHFQIDTRVDVTIIPERIYRELQPTPALSSSSKTLIGPAKTALPVRGCFRGKIQEADKSLEQEIFVVDGAHRPLLGRPAIEALKIVELVQEVETTDFKAKFPNLFKGLGKLDGLDYKIKLKPDAKPHALLSKVKEELSCMEQMQIISRVDEPTKWRAGMVVVSKANGKVRICVDLTKLNANILREFHPLPSVDRTHAQLAGAAVFTKLDAIPGSDRLAYHQSQQN